MARRFAGSVPMSFIRTTKAKTQDDDSTSISNDDSKPNSNNVPTSDSDKTGDIDNNILE